jgi:ABC-type multidrug transport system permease subunit
VGIINVVTLTSMAIGFLISALSPTVFIANAIGAPVLIIFLLFGGFYINTDSLPVGSQWVPYISFIKWGFQVGWTPSTL